MADCPTVAIESRKQAARRPRPPLPSAGSISSSSRSVRLMSCSFQHIPNLLIPAEVQQVVAGQTTDQEFHRDVVDVALTFTGFARG